MSTIRFTEDHEWLRLDGDVATVGITPFAQDALGDIVFVQLPQVGASLAAGAEAAVVESVKAAGEVKMPLAGTVLAVNEALLESPATVNADPLNTGWFIQVRLANPAEFSSLLDQAAYDQLNA
jgi:glycine cleavage system H protein